MKRRKAVLGSATPWRGGLWHKAKEIFQMAEARKRGRDHSTWQFDRRGQPSPGLVTAAKLQMFSRLCSLPENPPSANIIACVGVRWCACG